MAQNNNSKLNLELLFIKTDNNDSNTLFGSAGEIHDTYGKKSIPDEIRQKQK